jgi:hypothetical protein
VSGGHFHLAVDIFQHDLGNQRLSGSQIRQLRASNAALAALALRPVEKLPGRAGSSLRRKPWPPPSHHRRLRPRRPLRSRKWRQRLPERSFSLARCPIPRLPAKPPAASTPGAAATFSWFSCLLRFPPPARQRTTHGSPWNYDAQVPLILWGSAFKPGFYATKCEPTDLAGTLAARLGLTQPSGSEGTPLTVALK